MDDPRLNNPFLDRKVKPKKKKVSVEHLRAQKAKDNKKYREKVNFYEKYVKNNPKHQESVTKHLIKARKQYIRDRLLHKKYMLSWQHKKIGQVRVCSRCGKEWGYGFFDFLRDPKKDKKVRRPYCYNCRKELNHEYYEKTKETKKERNAAYYAANKEKLKQQMKENYARRKYGHLTEEDIPEKIRKNATFLTSNKKRKKER